jgi:hypothetical protein
MKVKKTKVVEVEEEVSIPEILEMLFEYDWWPDDWEGTRDSFIESLKYDNPDITKEEIKTILLEAKKEFDSRVENLIKEESEQLRDRESIKHWLDNIILEGNPFSLDEGMVGYCLTLDQIVDLIIQNGNKI